MELTQKRKITRATLQILFAIAAILAIALMVYSVFGLRAASVDEEQLQSFGDDWSVQSGVSSKRVSLPKGIDLTETGRVVLSNRLPDSITDADMLCVELDHQNLEVLVDGEQIYAYKNSNLVDKFVGKTYCFVPLTADMNGKEIELVITTLDQVSTTYVQQPCIGSGDSIYRQLLLENSFGVVSNSFFLLMGLGLLVTTLVLCLKKMDQQLMAIFSMGLFLVLSGLYGLYRTGLPAFMFHQDGLVYALGCSAKLLLLVPLLIYFTEVLSFKHRFMSTVGILSIMNFIVQCIVYLSGAADFGSMELGNLALWLLTGLYVAFILTVEFVKYRRHELGLRMAAMWVLAVMAVTNVICAWIFPSVSTILFDSICTFIYLVLLVVDVLGLIADAQREYIEERFSSQMALLDGLTRMPNRSSYNRHLEQLAEQQNPEQTVAVVDIRISLDELIQMNQKQGYNAGDEMVVGCGKCVTRAFRNLGRCYRISGNEFVVVAEQHAEEEIQAAVEVFWLTISDFNNEHINPLHPCLGYQIDTGVTTREQMVRMLEKAVALASDHV